MQERTQARQTVYLHQTQPNRIAGTQTAPAMNTIIANRGQNLTTTLRTTPLLLKNRIKRRSPRNNSMSRTRRQEHRSNPPRVIIDQPIRSIPLNILRQTQSKNHKSRIRLTIQNRPTTRTNPLFLPGFNRLISQTYPQWAQTLVVGVNRLTTLAPGRFFKPDLINPLG